MTNKPACPPDDLTAVVAPGRAFEMCFTSTPRGARLARRPAAHRLDTWGIPYGGGPHEAVALVVGELTANAVRHGHVSGRDFHLRLYVTGPAAAVVRIEVTDTRAERTPPRPEALRAADPEARGLVIVAGLASRWGRHARSGGPGKTVWAECAAATPLV
ncbi:ATP-binding protein [Streptomyces sp. NPDC086549]|uniref:ATP-binding protein n=1 Tax=Streptomyces sp. NPDC086549 TaxID=3365752 RepID=UPI00380D82A6